MHLIGTQSLLINRIGRSERTYSNAWEKLVKHQKRTTERSDWLKILQ
jgi:hypothetical protein